MLRSLYTAATGMEAEQLKMDTIANNLANSNTTGFKRSAPSSRTCSRETIVQAQPAGPAGRWPAGAAAGRSRRAHRQHHPLAWPRETWLDTQNPYDVAIEGNGYFRIQRRNGDIAYTRAGNFRVDDTGRLVTQRGELVEPGITVPPETTAITIQPDGTVLAKRAGPRRPTDAGRASS